MPIPEPGIYRPSNLTKKQQQEQLAAVYGVPMSAQLTAEEIERMRQIVQQHDGERKPMQTIDLNNPPRQPYQFKKFPMMVYDLEASKPGTVVHKLVSSEDQLQEAIEDGWTSQAPAFGETPQYELSAKNQNEASRVQDHIEEIKRRKGGRPTNAERAAREAVA